MARQLRRERGTALLIALFAAVEIVLIGTAHLEMTRTESEIASNEALALQARYAAEAAALAVKLWFEDPGNAPGFPAQAAVVREREIVDEADPYGAHRRQHFDAARARGRTGRSTRRTPISTPTGWTTCSPGPTWARACTRSSGPSRPQTCASRAGRRSRRCRRPPSATFPMPIPAYAR